MDSKYIKIKNNLFSHYTKNNLIVRFNGVDNICEAK